MHRKAVVFAFLFAFSAMIAWSLGQSGGQTAVPQAGTSTAQPAQPAQPQAGNEAAKAEDKNAAAQTRSFTENSKPFVADRHIAGGLQCSSCHGLTNRFISCTLVSRQIRGRLNRSSSCAPS